MMFARMVFTIAALIGFGALVPLYQAGGTPTYLGLIGAVAAWQVLFLMIAWQPVRLRLAMIPAALEKLFWLLTMFVLYLRDDVTAFDFVATTAGHTLLGVLFVVAFYRTPRPSRPAA